MMMMASNGSRTWYPVSVAISSDMEPAISSLTRTSSFSLTGALPVEQTDQASAKKNELSIHVIVSLIEMFASISGLAKSSVMHSKMFIRLTTRFVSEVGDSSLSRLRSRLMHGSTNRSNMSPSNRLQNNDSKRK